jgi:hypothetical protein
MNASLPIAEEFSEEMSMTCMQERPIEEHDRSECAMLANDGDDGRFYRIV